jgi:acetylornithine deacetylase
LLGPRGANAHAGDEYVEISSLVELTAILLNLIVDWCGVAP